MTMLSEFVLSKNHLIAIGHIATNWSYSESYLELLIWKLIGIDNDGGHCVTTHLNSETRINILESLAKRRLPIPGLRSELSKCVAEIRRLRTVRNNIVHGLWLHSKKPSPIFKLGQKGRRVTPQIAKVTAKGEIKITNTLWTAKKIMKVAEEISELSSRLSKLDDDIKANADRRQAIAEALLARQTLAQTPSPKNKAP